MFPFARGPFWVPIFDPQPCVASPELSAICSVWFRSNKQPAQILVAQPEETEHQILAPLQKGSNRDDVLANWCLYSMVKPGHEWGFDGKRARSIGPLLRCRAIAGAGGCGALTTFRGKQFGPIHGSDFDMRL